MQHPASSTGIAIIGAGSIGIAVAYYLVKKYQRRDIVLIDPQAPMSQTSAQSGENYRNWWPHPLMTALTNDSIGLMEDIARASGNRIQMTRRGYALVTRKTDPAPLLAGLYQGYGEQAEQLIRVHQGSGTHNGYQPPITDDWQQAPDGFDLLCDTALIRRTFPSYAHDVGMVLHVRRAGSIDSQQLGQFMLQHIRENGGKLIRAKVTAIESGSPLTLTLQHSEGQSQLAACQIVNAAGPWLNDIAAMSGEKLPVGHVYQQKIAFADTGAAISRDLPFTIDMDAQQLAWSAEERDILAQEPASAWLTETLPGNIHCRPDGRGQWLKLGWAFNQTPSDPHQPAPINPLFPDLVLRAASRLQPALARYIGQLPRATRHYGGYYTMTTENWPLIGPTASAGLFVAGALSGFGSMAACATGSLMADWLVGEVHAPYAKWLSPQRYQNPALMAELHKQSTAGHL